MWRNTEAVIFDLDGTLVDSSEIILAAFQDTLRPYGFEITNTDIEKIRSRSTHDLFEGYVPESEREAAFAHLAAYAERNLERYPSFMGVPELLKALQDSKKHKMALWTGRDNTSAEQILRHNRLEGFFEQLVGNLDVKSNKPSAEGLELLCERLSIAPENCVVVGDHKHDMEGAKALGAKAVFVSWSQAADPNTVQMADAFFSSISAFQRWMH